MAPDSTRVSTVYRESYRTSDLLSKSYVDNAFHKSNRRAVECLVPRLSLGYDSKRPDNLLLLSADAIAFSAGNLLVLYNMQSRKQQFVRSTGGAGIGHIAVSDRAMAP